MKNRILLILSIALISLCSCAALREQAAIRKQTKYLDVKIFQTLSKYEALAAPRLSADVVKITTQEDLYYDGKEIKGYFILIDTYTYEANSGITKTVPVYISLDEYKKRMK